MTRSAESLLPQFPNPPDGFDDSLASALEPASRILSGHGFAQYVEGALTLAQLGRGYAPVEAWLEHLPIVAEECGEDTIQESLAAALKLASMTSGEILALLFASLPVAARRLGDPELFRGYLTLIHQLAAKAARGLRPMLQHMDSLLAKLTLSGLKRWALFGAEAYRHDLARLTQYFALESPDSLRMLQQQRRGTLFVDAQRKLNLYLRALWGRDFFMRPAADDVDGYRPHIMQYMMYLPDALDHLGAISGDTLYRAMAAHQAAHIEYTTAPLNSLDLTPAQRFFVGLVEDARVEFRASQAFPGLGVLWGQLLETRYPDPPPHPTVAALEAVALFFNDPGRYVDITPELLRLAGRFHRHVQCTPDDNAISFSLGLELFDYFAKTQDVPSLRILNAIRIPYRDDNRFIWEFRVHDFAQRFDLPTHQQSQIRRPVSVLEMAHEVDCELAGDDAQEIWVCSDTFMPYEDAGEATVSFNDMWGTAPLSPPHHYPEWDYLLQLYRPDWVTVFEQPARFGDPSAIDQLLARHQPIVNDIQKIIDMIAPSGVQRLRNLEDGDEVDLNAAIDALIDLRSGRQPDPRVMRRNQVKHRDLAVTLLLDLSESTNDVPAGMTDTVLNLTQTATSLLSLAIDGIGDPFSVAGFASNGRHAVHYTIFKSFDQPFGQIAKARLAGMQGAFSTRMGAALRHASNQLMTRPEGRKLILLVTDGAPADIDERDPQHLRHDTKKTVEELNAQGISTFCLTLDPAADHYIRRLFGAGQYMILDDVSRLPEQLPSLFATLTQS